MLRHKVAVEGAKCSYLSTIAFKRNAGANVYNARR